MKPSSPVSEIRNAIVASLSEAADPERARQQQAYMKSEMHYFGVAMPQCRHIANTVFRAHMLTDADTWEGVVLHLWRRAAHREERYAAIGLLLFRPYSDWLSPSRIAMVEEMVVTGVWWDYVDQLASHGTGAMLAARPEEMKPILRDWSVDENIWKRRTAILSQLRFRDATDPVLLEDVIAPPVASPEFFLRKGIGWALREYSKTDPAWVIDFVHARPELSGLSRREALRHIERKGAGA